MENVEASHRAVELLIRRIQAKEAFPPDRVSFADLVVRGTTRAERLGRPARIR